MTTHSRTYPAFPIPAVGAVILAQEHILLIQRGQPPALGQWTLPGGVVEVGESPEEAIIREVREECSVEISVLSVLEVINRIVRDDHHNIKYHYIIIDYLAHCQASGSSAHEVPPKGKGADGFQRNPEEVSLPAIASTSGADVMDVCWVPFQDLPQYDVTEGLLPVIRAGIAMHAQWKQI
jgi:ADP-ribose pyrophosphatase YjhB (NUDIX family)